MEVYLISDVHLMSHKKTFNGTANSERYIRYFENDLKNLDGKRVFLLGDTFEFMNNGNLAEFYQNSKKYNAPVYEAFRRVVDYIRDSDILVFEGNHDSRILLNGIGIDAISSYSLNDILFEHGHKLDRFKSRGVEAHKDWRHKISTDAFFKVVGKFDYAISLLERLKPVKQAYLFSYLPKTPRPPRRIIGHVHARFDHPNLRVLEPYYRRASIHLYDSDSDFLKDLRTGFTYSSSFVE